MSRATRTTQVGGAVVAVLMYAFLARSGGWAASALVVATALLVWVVSA